MPATVVHPIARFVSEHVFEGIAKQAAIQDPVAPLRVLLDESAGTLQLFEDDGLRPFWLIAELPFEPLGHFSGNTWTWSWSASGSSAAGEQIARLREVLTRTDGELANGSVSLANTQVSATGLALAAAGALDGVCFHRFPRKDGAKFVLYSAGETLETERQAPVVELARVIGPILHGLELPLHRAAVEAFADRHGLAKTTNQETNEITLEGREGVAKVHFRGDRISMVGFKPTPS